MNNYVWLKIETDNYQKLLNKLNSSNIYFLEIKYFDKYLLLKVTIENYTKIKKYLISYKAKIYSYNSIKNMFIIFKNNLVYVISIIVGIILLLLANNLILRIDIKTNNNDIKELLNIELKNHKIKPLTLKKKHSNLEPIVKEIIEKNSDKIEWLEFKYNGLIMEVNVIEKTNYQKESNNNYCNIIANTDGKIISMNVYEGTIIKSINDYVKKGDIILSGDIILNEENKGTVCADGVVFGEVWYKISINVPLNETIKDYTGKTRYNFNVKINKDKYKIFKSRLKKYDSFEESIYKLNDFEINFVKEKEYKEYIKKLTPDKAYEKGIKLALEKVNLKLKNDESIIEKKVLKKTINDSTMYLDIFVVVKENIAQKNVME